jgi:sarcosine oxidase subunit gamma
VPDFALSPRSGLEHLLAPESHGLSSDGARGDAPGVIVALRTKLALALVMARKGKAEDLRRRLQDGMGLTVPMTAQRSEKAEGFYPDNLSLIWAGPGRWLARTSTRTASALEAILRTELSGLASIAKAHGVLAQSLPIDIDPRVFGPGDTALTLAGHVNVHLWQLDFSPAYEFAVPRSFAASFYDWLFAAAAKYGVLVRTD